MCILDYYEGKLVRGGKTACQITKSIMAVQRLLHGNDEMSHVSSTITTDTEFWRKVDNNRLLISARVNFHKCYVGKKILNSYSMFNNHFLFHVITYI